METVKGVDEDLDLLCPICYLYICEPVFTPCRHAFCKNCLVKSFGFNRPPRCPMCRGDCSRVKVMELKIDPEMEAAARKADPDYKERASKRKSERKLWMRSAILSPVVNNDNNAIFEVTGAGSEAVNGIYVVGNIPSYLGPRLYNKPGTQMYIFRWNRREWIIAELNRGFEDRRARFYRVSCSFVPEDVPPESGWVTSVGGTGVSPAPAVRPLGQGDRISPRLLQPLLQENIENSHGCSPCSIM